MKVCNRLYVASDIVPTCRYFETFNLADPAILDTRQKEIKEGKFDFVLAQEILPEYLPYTIYRNDGTWNLYAKNDIIPTLQ